MRTGTFILGMWLLFLVNGACQQRTLRITAPAQNERVGERPFIEGIVPNSNATVWVIVHPMETSGYWVQPAVSVKENSTWKVEIYVGRPGAVDSGKHFEIRAAANSKATLQEGQVLNAWPDAQFESQVIEVIRQ